MQAFHIHYCSHEHAGVASVIAENETQAVERIKHLICNATIDQINSEPLHAPHLIEHSYWRRNITDTSSGA